MGNGGHAPPSMNPLAHLHVGFVDHWPIMNPSELAFILITYMVFVLRVGPILMEARSPINIKGLLILYNTFKILNSSVLTCKFFYYLNDKGLFPEACDHDEITLYVIAALYWKYFVTKLLDLFDTIFFVLRKKNAQISFLHVYHHVFMVIISWTALKYDPSDHWGFMAFFNSLVHTIMYTYYCFAAMGPKFAKYLWWKKYLTMLQLIQFVLIIGHMVLQTYWSKCPIHAVTYWVGLSNTALFLLLFADFYVKRYKTPGQNKSSISLVCMRQNFD